MEVNGLDLRALRAAGENLPPPHALGRYLSYTPDSGALIWLPRSLEDMSSAATLKTWNSLYAGQGAGTKSTVNGYVSILFFGFRFYAHRAVWAMHAGVWPLDQIDHINHDRKDNRIENLRAVTVKENARNVSKRPDNKSGVTGVYWHKQRKKWHANIGVDRRYVSLGLHDNLDDAKKARAEAEIRYGFHANHGT